MAMPESAYLYGAALSLVVQILKPITKKYGPQASKNIVYLILFVAALGFTLLTSNPTWGQKVSRVIAVLMSAVATYEIIIKNVQPMIEKSFKSKTPPVPPPVSQP